MEPDRDTRSSIDLSRIDGQLIDGLAFCTKVYSIYDKAAASVGGVSALRLLKTREHKRLLEELLPMARYVLARYQEGVRLAVKFRSGSQPYDAELKLSGPLLIVLLPNDALLEVTTVVHENQHLHRQLVDSQGWAASPEALFKDKQTGTIRSEPRARLVPEVIIEWAGRISESIAAKAAKNYPPSTILIVNVVPTMILERWLFEQLITQVKDKGVVHPFLEVFIVERYCSAFV